jgi:Transposase IS66 family/Transposase C of IS166 homeodomain
MGYRRDPVWLDVPMDQPTSSGQVDPLPDEVAALKALLLAERAASAKLAGQNEQLRAIIKELRRALFGRRSEKTVHPDQLQLALEDIEQALAQIAEDALQRIAELYRIETMIRGLEPEQRRAARQDQSRPIVDDLRAWLDTTLTKLTHRSRTAEAIRYALKLWSGSPSSSTMAGSRSIPTWSSVRSARSPSIVRTHCSPAPTRVASTGVSSPP